MADISNWSTVEAENTHIDELTLSGEGGQYVNKLMCAVKKAIGDLSIAMNEATEGTGVLPVSVGGSGHGEYPERSTATDFNDYTTRGEFHVKFTSETLNAPVVSQSDLDCLLIVKRINSFSGITSSKRTIQIAIVINATHNTVPKIYIRKGFVESWSVWSEIAYVSGD